MEGFYRQTLGGTRKLLVEEKKELFQARLSPFRGRQGSYQADCLSLLWGWTGHIWWQTISSTQARKFPTEITFLDKVETALRSGSKLKFSVVALAQVTPFGACGFLLINTYQGYYTLQVCPNLFYRENYLYIYIYKTLAQGEDFKAKYLLKRDFLAEIK